jgi:hypothetical protein
MSIVDFNNRMKEYGKLLRHLPPPSTKCCNTFRGARWDEVSLTDSEIRCAIYDALPPDYKTYLRCNFRADWDEMNDQEFLDAMMSYEYIDQKKRRKWEEKQEIDILLTQKIAKKETKGGQRKRPYAKMSVDARQWSPWRRKFCQHCKDIDGKWWTHNTDECYFKEIDGLKGLIKSLKKKVNSDSDSE